VRHGLGGRVAPAHLHDHRPAQVLARQRLDLGRHGGAEQQRLAIRRDTLDDAIDLRREAHVEHAVRLVEHQHLEIVEHDVASLEMVEQPAGRRDDDVDAVAQRLLLRLVGHAAEDRDHVELRVPAVVAEARLDLHAQLARRGEHEDAGAARAAVEAVHQRQREGGRLAGARLREPHHVAPPQHERDRLRLDRGRALVPGLGDRAEDGLRETQLGEGGEGCVVGAGRVVMWRVS
jgi:hypothetical protein